MLQTDKTAVVGYMAAAFANEIYRSVTIREMIPSWEHIVQASETFDQWVNVVHGALQHYDLPDLIELAGGRNVFGSSPRGYLPLDIPAATAARPDVALFFSEPEYPVDPGRLLGERGWDAPGGPRVIVSTVDRGRNIIHDGPSFLDTAHWLAGRMHG